MMGPAPTHLAVMEQGAAPAGRFGALAVERVEQADEQKDESGEVQNSLRRTHRLGEPPADTPANRPVIRIEASPNKSTHQATRTADQHGHPPVPLHRVRF